MQRRNQLIRLCGRAELPAEGHAKEFTVKDKTLCVATVQGKPVAVDNVCPHRGGPLAEGSIEHGKVICPWHQWEFDLATGVATHSPHASVAVYRLEQQGDDIMVDL